VKVCNMELSKRILKVWIQFNYFILFY